VNGHGEVPYASALIQFRPIVSSGERLNVGVIVHSPETGQVAWHVSDRYGRLTSVYPNLDGASYRRMISHIRNSIRRAAGNQEATQGNLQLKAVSLESILNTVIPSPSSNFTWIVLGHGLCTDVAERARELRSEFITRFEGQKGRERIDDRVIWERVQENDAFHQIAAVIHPRKLETSNYEYTFRGSWTNGRLQVVEPVSFDYVKPGDMLEEANKWRGRLEELRSSHDFQMTAIVSGPVSLASNASGKYEQATAILRRSPVVREVFSEWQVEAFVSLVKDDLEAHRQG
jgi:hypothetical protein